MNGDTLQPRIFQSIPRSSFLKLLVSVLFAALAFSNDPAPQAQTQRPLTVEEIWAQPSPAETAPKGLQWVPDGGRITFLSPESDLIQVQPTTSEITMLVS